MKIVLAGALAALALAGATVATTEPAQARLNFGVTIYADNVRFAYRDGYWDRWHRWHPWADPDDWRWYRMHYPARYYDWRHDRDRDMGWRVAVVGPPAGISFRVDDVMYAYRDGWWDRWHRWHPWAAPGEWSWWRANHPDRYWDWVHTRDPDMGWRVTGYMGGPGVGVVVGPSWLSFRVTDIAYAYRDGWWDRWHRWHVWRSGAERDWWRDHYQGRYWDWHHDRDPDLGWHGWHDQH